MVAELHGRTTARCERPGCGATALGFVVVEASLPDRRIVTMPYGYRCEPHARDGVLQADFTEEVFRTYAGILQRMFPLGPGAQVKAVAGVSRLTDVEGAELRGVFEVEKNARPGARLPVEIVSPEEMTEILEDS